MNEDLDINHQGHFVPELASLAVAASDHRETVDHGTYVLVPDKYKLVDLDHRLLAPRRTIRDVNLKDLESFLSIAEKFKNEASGCYWESSGMGLEVTCVFDDVLPNATAWGHHQAILITKFSPEYEAWKKNSGNQMTQVQFAQFVEDNLPDFSTPDGATMLEISRKFLANKKVEFSSEVRLQNGDVQVTYLENTEAKAKGQINFPSEFTLGIPILSKGDPYEVKCNLRYKLNDGRLMMWFDIVRQHKLLEAAFDDVLAKVRELGMPVLQGHVDNHYPKADE
jgi:uncharacterized protein YfdQ (DUF2303 family)